MLKHILLITVLFITFYSATAQGVPSSATNTKRFSILAGLNQPLVFHGFNIEVNYYTKKWVFDYSHGFGLHVDGKFAGGEYEAQHIDFKITHSFGAGIGYRFTEAFNLRFEPKIHCYQTYMEGDPQTKVHSIANFNTYTLGLGAYYRWLPFKNTHTPAKGITIVPSVRYWYKVASDLPDNEFSYQNSKTGKSETIKAPNIGIANTPLLINVSVGYSF
jgi:hypothetical protein